MQQARQKQVRHADQQQLIGDASAFDGETTMHTAYKGGDGQRFDTVRPTSSDMWKSADAFDASTTNNADYRQGKGERFETSKPTESEHWKTNEKFDDRTVSHDAYLATTGDRYEKRIPPDSNTLRGDGQFSVETTNQQTYKGELVNDLIRCVQPPLTYGRALRSLMPKQCRKIRTRD